MGKGSTVMKIVKAGVCGTMESSDILITVEEGEGLSIDLKSSVEKQYGEAINNLIKDTLAEMDIQNAHVLAVDHGALDCTIRARLITAITRAGNESVRIWGGR